MAEQEVAVAVPAPAPAASPSPGDNKRKLEDLEQEPTVDSDAVEVANGDDGTRPESPEAKRQKLEEKPDGLATENGHQEEKASEPVKEDEKPSAGSLSNDDEQSHAEKLSVGSLSNDGELSHVDNNGAEDDKKPAVESIKTEDNSAHEEAKESGIENSQADDVRNQPKEIQETMQSGKSGESADELAEIQQPPLDNSLAEGVLETAEETGGSQMTNEQSDTSITKRRMDIPNTKVGVLIGKAGDTIRNLQYNSGAKIQITRDAEADPRAPTRSLEIVGTVEQIDNAEKLIKAVIAEADAGGSPSLVARGLATAPATSASEQIQIQVPNEKVGLIIGRGGETIKGLQTRSGARIQLIPQHLPEGDESSKERIVRVTGEKKQIEMARELIKEVLSQPVRSSAPPSSYNQQVYRPRGPNPQWGPRSPYFGQPVYDYRQRGPYPPHNAQYHPSAYGNHPQQQLPPRSNFGSGWEQRPFQPMQGPPAHTGGYDYYGGAGSHVPDHSSSASLPRPHAPGPSPGANMGPQAHSVYNYGQPQDYGQPAPYPQAVTQQGYGHVYEEPKYESQGQGQHPYGGHPSSQAVYSQSGTHSGYAQQQYAKPAAYGMQGPSPQSYGPPRAGQPGDVAYQGAMPSSQPYGPGVPAQQSYPYATGGPMQQQYPPYGSVPGSDGYNQAASASAASGYVQQGSQGAPGYVQPGGQQAGVYAQVGTAVGYGQYPAAQGYTEQQQSSAGYGQYPAAQDPNYAGGGVTAYSAPPAGQAVYAQQAVAQAGYDQVAQQSGGYGVQQGATPAGYVKTLSPQRAAAAAAAAAAAGYTQYDSTQMYAAPH